MFFKLRCLKICFENERGRPTSKPFKIKNKTDAKNGSEIDRCEKWMREADARSKLKRKCEHSVYEKSLQESSHLFPMMSLLRFERKSTDVFTF